MGVKVLLVLLVISVVANSDEFYGRSHRIPEYSRIKRAKYYSSSPNRFYRKPPTPFLTKGAFSYTPPPNYMENEDPHPGSLRPKVSTGKRPVNDGLGDDDINNLVKHLSKQDLDRIIEFAGDKYGSQTNENKYGFLYKIPNKTDDISIYKVPEIQEIDTDKKFSLNGPYLSGNKEDINYEMEYSDVSKRPSEIERNVYKSIDNSANQFMFKGPYANVQNSPPQFYKLPEIPNSQDLSSIPLDTQESMHNNQFSKLNAYIQQELNGAASDKVINTFTDSKVMQEEQLPRPVNLREDIYEASNTNNVANVVKPNSYKLENFGDLPLMDYSSKRDTVSSYHVPHYSVVSSSNHAPPPPPPPPPPPSSSYGLSSAVQTPALEPAPPVSSAKEQSDAHLKAIKIWTHRSKGTAYTLHNDGSLSLEKPGRPKTPYGYS